MKLKLNEDEVKWSWSKMQFKLNEVENNEVEVKWSWNNMKFKLNEVEIKWSLN